MRSFHWPKGVLPLLTLLLAAVALARPRPMLVNLGAGDEGLARGFQAWERAGRDGLTMFRWSLDGATIELPAHVRADSLRARVRIARFVNEPVTLTWRVNGRDAARQLVRPRGWHVETIDLGAVAGPLIVEIRSFDAPESVGAAIDWIELSGARRVVPRARAWTGLFLLVLVAPMIAHLIAGSGAAHSLAGVMLVTVPAMLWMNPAAGLETVATGAPVVLAALVALALVSRLPIDLHAGFAAGAVAATVAVLALMHPSFFYPDVDTHARLLAAIRHEPALALDPGPFQERTGAWTRSLGGTKVAFPYSPAFHVAAWPLALAFGDTAAVKLLAAIAFGSSVLLVFALARALGLGVAGAVLAQGLFAFLPVESSRLCLALFPTLFGQALELALLCALAMNAPARDARGLAMLTTMAVGVQAAYTGSLMNVAAVFAFMAFLLWRAGDPPAAGRLAVLGAASTVVVGLALYGRFVPVWWTHVLPHASGAAGDAAGAEAPGAVARVVGRVWHFFGAYPVLVALGLRLPLAAAARRAALAALLAGGAFLALRGFAPAAARDFKEVELLAAPVALFSAAALAWLSQRRQGRLWAALAAAAFISYGLFRAVAAYAAGIVVDGRS